MTKEDKQLLLKDLCARLAFGRVKCQVKVLSFNEEMDEHIELLDDEIVFIEPGIYNAYLYNEGTDVDISDIKPYLRPMSSMTEEEKKELDNLVYGIGPYYGEKLIRYSMTVTGPNGFKHEFCIRGGVDSDWFNAHHFDYRGLIEKGLALEAPEGMY